MPMEVNFKRPRVPIQGEAGVVNGPAGWSSLKDRRLGGRERTFGGDGRNVMIKWWKERVNLKAGPW